MNVSKDILRHLIENYFHLTEIYQCQFVSKFTRSCITPQKLYDARCSKVAINMQKKQNKYLIKRRKENIEYFVDLNILRIRISIFCFLQNKIFKNQFVKRRK